jgi:hypothetical protein
MSHARPAECGTRAAEKEENTGILLSHRFTLLNKIRCADLSFRYRRHVFGFVDRTCQVSPYGLYFQKPEAI